MRWEIINYFIKKYNYKSYLEIGYYKGWSFDRVECSNKTAVDPNPSKDEYQQKMGDGEKSIHICTDEVGRPELNFEHVIYKTTSDRFFEIQQLFTKNKKTWDIIFIDGLHEANQVLKDLNNSLNHLSSNGIIIMHDCNPPKYEHTTTGIDGCWTGDVYKTAVAMRMTYPYSFYVVDTDWGVGVLRKPENYNIPYFFPGVDDYKIEWDSFDKGRYSLLNIKSVEEFLEREKPNETTKDILSSTK